ncbi:hypothetical protein [Pantoea agglomerans]|nr:hypothetical protein [Pantoea agglomerans]WNK39773.1 hypothetical protein RM160_18580 [Pantoea agglomerans]
MTFQHDFSALKKIMNIPKKQHANNDLARYVFCNQLENKNPQ